MIHTLERGVWACVQDPQGEFLSSGNDWTGKGVTVRGLLLFVSFGEKKKERKKLPANPNAAVVLFFFSQYLGIWYLDIWNDHFLFHLKFMLKHNTIIRATIILKIMIY